MKKLFFLSLLLPVFANAQNTYPYPATGNIGIGTTSPQRPLDVNGVVRALTYEAYNGTVNTAIRSNDAVGGDIGTFSPHYLRIFSNNVEQMRLLANGNFGIGTTTPTQKLHVNGNILFGQGNFFGTNLTDVMSYDNKSQPNYGIQWTMDSWSSLGASTWLSGYGGIKLFTAGAVRMAINDAGKISIGTGFPVAKLTIWDANADEGAISVQSGSDSRFFIKEGGNVLKIGMVTGGLYPLNVVNSGKVGIGTITPGDKLTVQDVDGTVTAGAHTVATFIRSPGATARGIVLGYYADGTNETAAVIRAANNADLLLEPNGGNVGIGTAITGTCKLAVEGTIGARKVKVTQSSSWADFVFDPAYKLPSLQEVESYITANKHLPDVPSAAEIIKDGQDLGEMNKILLQKIEELTLYMIEMKKENEEQKARVDQLMDLIKGQQETSKK